MYKTIVSLFVLVFLVAATGCGSGYRVSGKVTFSDGTPVTIGEVLFEGKLHTAKGKIGSDGTYVMGLDSPNSGLPKDSYRVCIVGVNERGQDVKMGGFGGAGMSMPSYISLIHSKYGGSDKSGLTCEVKGKTVYDIALERAEPKKDGKR